MIIIVFGFPGSGKTYFASRLAKELRAEYINSDKVRNLLHARGKYTLDDKLGVYLEMLNKVSDFLQQSKSVVVDATFSFKSMRTIFMDEANKHHATIKFIRVKADEDLTRARLSKPRSDSEADFDVYLKIRDEFEDPDFSYLEIESSDSNIGFMLNKAKAYINL